MTVSHERRHPTAHWRRCRLWYPWHSAPWGRWQLPKKLLQKKLPRRVSRHCPRRALHQTPPLSDPSRSNELAHSAATGGMIPNTAMHARIRKRRKRRRKRKNGKVRPLQPPTQRPKRLRNSRRNVNGQRSGNTSYRHLYGTGRATTSSCTIYHHEVVAATSGT